MDKTELGFDSINLGHGSGGLMTRDLLDKVIFKTFSNPFLDQKHDGSIVKFNGPIAISTDSFVVSPIFFKGGNIGELAVHGTVNDVAMCGAIPKYLSLAFIVEEGLKMEEFITIVESIKEAADISGVQIITGDTKVVDKGKGDKIFINTTGIGQLHPKADIATKNIKVGDRIIVSNQIATHGIAILSVREGLKFETTIESDTTNLNHSILDLLDKFGNDIHLFRDPTRGGLSSTLNEIARDTRTGIVLQEKSLPIDNQVKAACEILGLDPLYTANEGVFVAFVSGEIADDVVKTMKTLDNCKHATIIGEVVSDHPSKVVITNTMGGKRVVSMQVGEQLPRIC